MTQTLIAAACLGAILLWLFQGIPNATSPRGSFGRELWLAVCVASFPMLIVGLVAYNSPDPFGKAELGFLVVSKRVAATGSAMALWFLGVLALRLALARRSPYAPEQLEGKRILRCPLGGFQLLYPRTWKVKRTSTLTYTFVSQQEPRGVLRLTRIYADSAPVLVREFKDLVADAGLTLEDFALDEARALKGEPPAVHLGARPFDPERDGAHFPLRPGPLLRRASWALFRNRLLFVLDYTEPGGRKPEARDLDLRPLEELIESLYVVQAHPKPG